MTRKKEFLHLRIDSEDKAILKMLAEAYRMSTSELVRYLLRESPKFKEANSILIGNKLNNLSIGAAPGI